ncbi:MAG: TonB family protein [Pseudomonadota bacterium]
MFDRAILASIVLTFLSNNASPQEVLSVAEIAELPKARLNNTEAFGERLIGNYPMTTIRQDVRGTVTILVRVTTQGRAVDCEVLKSSSNAIIDQWACRGTVRYARFDIVLNEQGKPIQGHWSKTFTLTIGDPGAADLER